MLRRLPLSTVFLYVLFGSTVVIYQQPHIYLLPFPLILFLFLLTGILFFLY